MSIPTIACFRLTCLRPFEIFQGEPVLICTWWHRDSETASPKSHYDDDHDNGDDDYMHKPELVYPLTTIYYCLIIAIYFLHVLYQYLSRYDYCVLLLVLDEERPKPTRATLASSRLECGLLTKRTKESHAHTHTGRLGPSFEL